MIAIDPTTAPLHSRLPASASPRCLDSLRVNLGVWLARVVLASVPAALALATAGCSTQAMPAPRGPLPAVTSGAAACHVTGDAKVIARRVFVPGGVEASADDGSLSVRFATARSRCVAVDWPSASARAAVSCLAPGARTDDRAGNGDGDGAQTRMPWGARRDLAPRTEFGIMAHDAPATLFGFTRDDRHVEGPAFEAPVSASGHPATPEFAPIGHDRFLLAWVDSDVETSQVRAQSVIGGGEPMGPSMVVSPPDATVIGRPSVAVAPTGYGLVTYIASVGEEFDVLATPIACAMN